jgi:membrane associated rhomboid family serine protease
MFGAALRLMAVGEAGQRLGGYVRNLTKRYLVLSMAGIPFVAATAFGILAAYWALNSRIQDPIWAALTMVGILVLVGLLIVLIAYGITREETPSARQALTQPVRAVQNQLPTADDVGRQIERAVQQYGPVRVATAAAAGGLLAGLLAKKFRQV